MPRVRNFVTRPFLRATLALCLSVGLLPHLEAACSGPLEAGDACEFTIRADGRDRNYLLQVPVTHDGAPVPLVIDIHGFTSTPEGQRSISGMLEVSNREGFAVAWPRGGIAAPPSQTTDFQRGFNASAGHVTPGCCATPALENWDDTAFIVAVKADVQARMAISRVHVTGLSNGSWMGHRLLCEAPEAFDAFALTAAGLSDSWDDCQPTVPRPLIYMHGRNDTVVPIAGAADLAGERMLSADATMAIYAQRNQCTGYPDSFVTTHMAGTSWCREYTGCAQRLAYCELEAPHVTYHATPLDVAEIFWDFLDRTPRGSFAVLDLDGDGQVRALTDGLLLLRHLFGFRGDALIDGSVGNDAERGGSDEISGALARSIAEGALDIDGDGSVTALTDGLLVLRRLFGFADGSLVANATGEGGSRREAGAVASYIDALRESASDSAPER